MAVKAKGRRRIVVEDKNYVWYVKIDYDSPYYILNVISEDKLLIVSCPIGTRTNYIISKGNKFQNRDTNGQWNRYLLPFSVSDTITPITMLSALMGIAIVALPAGIITAGYMDEIRKSEK